MSNIATILTHITEHRINTLRPEAHKWKSVERVKHELRLDGPNLLNLADEQAVEWGRNGGISFYRPNPEDNVAAQVVTAIRIADARARGYGHYDGGSIFFRVR